ALARRCDRRPHPDAATLRLNLRPAQVRPLLTTPRAAAVRRSDTAPIASLLAANAACIVLRSPFSLPLRLFHYPTVTPLPSLRFDLRAFTVNRHARRVVTNKLKRNHNPLKLLRHGGADATCAPGRRSLIACGGSKTFCARSREG